METTIQLLVRSCEDLQQRKAWNPPKIPRLCVSSLHTELKIVICSHSVVLDLSLPFPITLLDYGGVAPNPSHHLYPIHPTNLHQIHRLCGEEQVSLSFSGFLDNKFLTCPKRCAFVNFKDRFNAERAAEAWATGVAVDEGARANVRWGRSKPTSKSASGSGSGAGGAAASVATTEVTAA